MRLLDLYSGRWGWGRVFAERGWDVVGVDLIDPEETPKGCRFVKANVLNMASTRMGRQSFVFTPEEALGHFDFIVASSPCEEFSVHRMKMFHPNPKYPELGIQLFNHTRALCEHAGVLYVMENVQTAQQFVGKAVAHAGSFYLWGSGVPTLLPRGLTKGMPMDRKWCQALGGHGSKKRNDQTAGFATIPPELAHAVAGYAERICVEK